MTGTVVVVVVAAAAAFIDMTIECSKQACTTRH
jgi:hypothetical protein